MYRSMLEAANEIYAEYISSGENIMEVAQKPTLIKLKNVIESVKKEDFGIASNQQANAILFSDSNTISYANIHQEDDERFSFGLFFIPKGGFLPLHDHPNMFVFSKILMGKVKRLSFSLSNRNIQFEYPIQIALQKIYLQQQQQQLLMQQRQVMAQKQQQMQFQQNQNHQGVENNINSILNNNNINQNNNNIFNNNNNTNNQTSSNLNKKHSPSQFNKQQIVDSSGQKIQQSLNEGIVKEQQAQANKSQNQLRQQLLMNLQTDGQRLANISLPKGNNNSANDLISISNQDNGTKFQNGQISSSPTLMEQLEKSNEIQIEDFKKNGMNNVDSTHQLQQQQWQQQLQKQYIQSQQIQQQQNSQLQQQQQAIKIDKRIPDQMNITQPQFIEATLDSEEILTEGFIDDLDPFHKNLHYIEAVEDCVFFDVLLPHYDLKKRYCNYYTILRGPDPQTRKAILSISNQPTNQNKVQYFTIEKSTCNYFN